MGFGKFAREKREEAHMTQQDAASALGMEHRSAFHKLEDGERDWHLGQIERFADALGTTPSQLLAEYERKSRR
jgi:transcriptional regulator with XRE-family HTH domain